MANLENSNAQLKSYNGIDNSAFACKEAGINVEIINKCIHMETYKESSDATPESSEQCVNQNVTMVYIQDDFEDLAISQGPCMMKVSKFQALVESFTMKHSSAFRKLFFWLLVIIFMVYFSYAMYHERLKTSDSYTLLAFVSLVVFFISFSWIKRKSSYEKCELCIRPLRDFLMKQRTKLTMIFSMLAGIGFLVYVGLVIGAKSPRNLTSLSGFIVFVVIGFIFSDNPGMVQWQVVFWGLGMQFTFAILVLRTELGYEIFKWLGDLSQTLVNYAEFGVVFVFGEAFVYHFFAMRALPVIIYIGALIAILYHWGVIQGFVQKFSWLMENTVGTTAGESTAAAANVFLGMCESPMLIAPLLGRMTDSELHCVLVGGFATIAGAGVATFILLGVPGNHLLTASIISAPCALAMSKLFKPETKRSKFIKGEKITFNVSYYKNTFDAACQGAVSAIGIIGCVICNLIAFISLLALLNSFLSWMGSRIGVGQPDGPPLTFQLILSYVLWPVAFCLGVPVEDCYSVAQLLGVKMFVNEYVAYLDLITLMENGATFRDHIISNGTYFNNGSDIWLPETNITLVGGVINRRSEVISTYALCGFANFGSIGVQLGFFSGLIPTRMNNMATYILRSMIAATMASYLTACTAGLLYDPDIEEIK